MIKTIIIDDESLARKRVKSLLEGHLDKIEIVGEASTAKEALACLKKEKVDLIFLDIHLPDMNGFEILKRLSYQPVIVFTTAYENYAIDAFGQFTIDYLVKPITQERFDQAMAKLDKVNWVKSEDSYAALFELLRKPSKGKLSSLAIKKSDKIILVDFEDIAYFKSEDKYVNVSLLNGVSHLTDKTLNQLEEICPTEFIRVHRSYLINKKSIKEIQKYFKGTLILKLDDKNQSAIKTGETYSKKVKSILGL